MNTICGWACIIRMIFLEIGILVFANNNRDFFPLKRLEVITTHLIDSKCTHKQVQLFCSTESLTKLKRDRGIIGTVQLFCSTESLTKLKRDREIIGTAEEPKEAFIVQ
ncbi:uncharacterized protein BX663DRAFT_545531 [Cokeromyces recurvatus]|uniref:uncharacterized protein n=1 Tax=Cokeromyces recurvatus TaxID=90255 RepID=UPI00222101C8|nr:uncharacterized protein BX663DRAFT_545531 [Cokeromyces recurvatus]KAI7899620.1 hypothetical protein BX663DRAFT_545531 [Cokeromyces recurvatus]